ncbi:MAG: FAD-dependent oxidoreductase [Cellvibrionaceae bacterium]
MKVVVLGAGVVGVSTAYMLAKQGCQVTVVDRSAVSGAGTSYANGGQLSYGYRTPIANPKVLKQLPAILLGLDPAFKITPSLDIDFYKWGIRYLLSSFPKASSRSASVMHDLGQLAKEKIAQIVNEAAIDFDYRSRAGKLYIYENEQELLKASKASGDSLVWSKKELLSHVPLLKSNPKVVGGVYDIEEDAADSYKFCGELVSFMEANLNVEFLANTAVESMSIKAGRVEYLVTNKGNIQADKFVLAMGPQSANFAKKIGITLPIYPMKGYSVTVPANDACPNISVTDTKTKTVYCKLGDRLRIAGFAELSGYDTSIKKECIDMMLNNAQKVLPGAGDYTKVLDQWCGLRPATPDSIPIVDQSRYDNVYLNTGHGMLGWTHSTATAEILSNMILGHSQPFDVSRFSLKRF